MFPPGFTCPAVLWIQLADFAFRLRDSHLLWYAFPHISTKLNRTHCCPNPGNISTPGLAYSAFARHYLRNLGWFLFLALLRCFSSGGSLPVTILFTTGWLDCSNQVAPFGNPRIYRLLTAPRGLSQLTTSFIGSQCQGIHLALFVAWPFLVPSWFVQILWLASRDIRFSLLNLRGAHHNPKTWRLLCDSLNDCLSYSLVENVILLPFSKKINDAFKDGCHWFPFSLVCHALFFVQFSRCDSLSLNSDFNT